MGRVRRPAARLVSIRLGAFLTRIFARPRYQFVLGELGRPLLSTSSLSRKRSGVRIPSGLPEALLDDASDVLDVRLGHTASLARLTDAPTYGRLPFAMQPQVQEARHADGTGFDCDRYRAAGRRLPLAGGPTRPRRRRGSGRPCSGSQRIRLCLERGRSRGVCGAAFSLRLLALGQGSVEIEKKADEDVAAMVPRPGVGGAKHRVQR